MKSQLGASLLELARFKTALAYCTVQCAVSPGRKKQRQKKKKKTCHHKLMCQENIFSTLASIYKQRISNV